MTGCLLLHLQKRFSHEKVAAGHGFTGHKCQPQKELQKPCFSKIIDEMASSPLPPQQALSVVTIGDMESFKLLWAWIAVLTLTLACGHREPRCGGGL